MIICTLLPARLGACAAADAVRAATQATATLILLAIMRSASIECSERIGRRMRLRDLHILLAVVQCKSMAKAAEHLAVSKPVVSKTIADLEHVLGVRVLERDRHGAEPTSYGAALLKRGITVFDELREGV